MGKHNWQLSEYTSPSGKMLYHCQNCGLYDPAPVKDEYETRKCVKDRYINCWEVRDGKVYAMFVAQ